MVPVTATPGTVNATIDRWWGFSVRDDAAGACVIEFRKGTVTGPIIWHLALASGESAGIVFPKAYPTEDGVYIKEVSGSIEGILLNES